MKCLGSRMITFVSLALATGACFILGNTEDTVKGEVIIQGYPNLTEIIKIFLFFSDSAIGGYLLICIAIAFLTVASLEEVLNGTENTLLRTKFSKASNLHLFVESAFMVHALM